MGSALSAFKSAKSVWKFGFGGVFIGRWCVVKWVLVLEVRVLRCDCFVFVWVYEKGRLAASSSKA